MTQKYQVKVSMKQAAIVETGIVLKQGDFGMQIEIEVLDFDATGTTPQIVFRKAMGAVESTTITVSSNKYTYTFKGTELDTPGKVFCDLKLKNSTTQRISTASFMFKVVADTLDGLEQEASSYSDTIEQIVGGFETEINDIKNTFDTKTNILIDEFNDEKVYNGTMSQALMSNQKGYFIYKAQSSIIITKINLKGVAAGTTGKIRFSVLANISDNNYIVKQYTDIQISGPGLYNAQLVMDTNDVLCIAGTSNSYNFSFGETTYDKYEGYVTDFDNGTSVTTGQTVTVTEHTSTSNMSVSIDIITMATEEVKELRSDVNNIQTNLSELNAESNIILEEFDEKTVFSGNPAGGAMTNQKGYFVYKAPASAIIKKIILKGIAAGTTGKIRLSVLSQISGTSYRVKQYTDIQVNGPGTYNTRFVMNTNDILCIAGASNTYNFTFGESIYDKYEGYVTDFDNGTSVTIGQTVTVTEHTSTSNMSVSIDIITVESEEVKDIKEDVTDIQGDITDIQGDITDIQGDVISIQNNVSELNAENSIILQEFDEKTVFYGNPGGGAMPNQKGYFVYKAPEPVVITKINLKGIAAGTTGKIRLGVLSLVSGTTYKVKRYTDIQVNGPGLYNTQMSMDTNDVLCIAGTSNSYNFTFGETTYDKYEGYVTDFDNGTSITTGQNISVDVHTSTSNMSVSIDIITNTNNIDKLNEQSTIPRYFSPIKIQQKNAMLKYRKVTGKFGLLGRWFKRKVNNIDCFATTNSGAEIYFMTEGASSVVVDWIPTTETNAYYTVSIDGGALSRVLITSKTITLPDSSRHIVRIITDGITENIDKWEYGNGYAFSDITIDAGSIKGIIPENPVIVFFGDSITEGIRALGITPTSDMGDTNSATGAFPYFCCENLGAVSYRCGYGAAGATQYGSFADFVHMVNYFCSSVKAIDASVNAIVVNIGTNDSGSTDENFTEKYTQALNQIKVRFPGVKVFCMIPFSQAKAQAIRSIVSNLDWCELIETSTWTGIETADGIHPTAAGAAVAAQYLSETLIDYIYGE